MRVGLQRAWVPVLVAVLAAALLLVVYRDLGRAVSWAGLTARRSLAWCWQSWGWWRRSWCGRGNSDEREASVSTSAQVDAAANLLAVRTSATWSKELVRRGIEAPAPVRVRWRWAGGDVALPEQELASVAGPEL